MAEYSYRFSIMNKILFGIGGLVIGLIIGFFSANYLNRNAELTETATAQNPAAFNEQVHSADIKESSAPTAKPLPEVQETLDAAKNELNNFDAQVKAGDLYLKIKGFEKAAEFYERAQKIKPDDFGILAKIGNTYFDAGQYEKAESWYEQALALKEDLSVRTDLGITFVQRANPDYERAIKEFETSLKTNPNHETTLYNLGAAYFKKGDAQKAQEILSKLEQINPNGDLTKKLRETIS